MEKYVKFLLVGIGIVASLIMVTKVYADVSMYQTVETFQEELDKTEWDKSSLSFKGECDATCDLSVVEICNGEDSEDMEGTTPFEVWYSESGNPKFGEIIYTGIVSALKSGECIKISFPTDKSGYYKVKAYQREGHPGTGELWSETCDVLCEDDVEECKGCKVIYYHKVWKDNECVWEMLRESEDACGQFAGLDGSFK